MKLSVPIFRLKRQAKQLARDRKISLNQALDRIAKSEGFQSWSLLAAQHTKSKPAAQILAELTSGDLVLLGARPGHGKTLMGLDLIAQAVAAGGQAIFYSLEYTRSDIAARLQTLGSDSLLRTDAFTFDTSDDICADYVIATARTAPAGSVVVIDYLQLLDQDRAKPSLAEQLASLKAFAKTTGVITILISQIDRNYDPATKPLPDISDVRLPNPVDLTLFTKMVFLNDGELRLQAVA